MEDVSIKLVKRLTELEGQRYPYEDTWDDITEFVLPHRGDFTTKRSPGTLRNRRLFDTTAIQANEFLASTLHGGLTTSSTKWFDVRSKNPAINAVEPAKQFMEAATNRLYEVFNNPGSNFQSQNHELFLDLVAYGTACMYIDDIGGQSIRFKAIHLSEIFIAEDRMGNIDTVFRKFKFTARQAAQFWRMEKLSPELQRAAKESPDKKFDFVHCVKPSEDFDSNKEFRQFPYSSYYIELGSKHLIDKRGYFEMPYLVPRWAKLVGEVYGRSPAWSALADIRMLNVMSKVILVAAEKQIDPPLLMADDGVMLPLQTKPGGINMGGLDLDGRPRIQTLRQEGRLDVGFNILEQRMKAVRNAYHVDSLLFREGPQMTATEVLQRQEEKLRLIGPQVGRIQSEYLNPLIKRVYGILQRNGQLPEIPDEVSDIVEAGGLDIEYSSPLFRTQRSQEPVAFQRLMQEFLPLVQAKPEILDLINADRSFRRSAEIFGVPMEMLNSTEETDAIRQQRAEAQQQAQMMQQADAMMETAANAKQSGLLDAE